MVDEGDSRDLDPSQIAIIHEVYDSENAHETFELELERALEAGCSIIVIEPSRLGDETARWIAVGNCLRKTAVFSSICSIGAGFIWPDRPCAYAPLTAVSLLCTGLYAVSWQLDPCCQYQVERDRRHLPRRLPPSCTQASAVVLVRRPSMRFQLLHVGVSFVATAFWGWRLYQALK